MSASAIRSPSGATEHRSLKRFAQEVVKGSASHDRVVEVLRSLDRSGYGARDVLDLAMVFREATVPVYTRHPAVADLCGTGGGSARTFNISTAASFVVAGADVPVAKHGNRSNAGRSGSADVMEALGAVLPLTSRTAGAILDDLGVSFFFARAFNPAMRNAASARKAMRGKTIFNVLGPLLNPVQGRKRQLIGVYDPKLLDLLPPVLAPLDIERCLLVHGDSGMDEVSVLGPTRVALVQNGSLERFDFDPGTLGLRTASPEDIADRPAKESALLIRRVLEGEENGAPRDAVLLNAAFGLVAFGRCNEFAHAFRVAEHALDSRQALLKLDAFVARSREDGA